MERERKDPSFFDEAPRTVLEPGASVSGKLVYDSPVKIDGRFKGEIKANALLVLGPEAEVAAKIAAGQLRIEGSLVGTVRVDGWIEIMPGGRFQGRSRRPAQDLRRRSVRRQGKLKAVSLPSSS
jgi:cytoskeletal protein CcmA (bactofilin family)